MEIIRSKFRANLKPTLFRFFVSLLLFGTVLTQEHVPNVQAQAGAPQLILTKTVEGNVTTAQVGDTIRYRIRFECSSLTTSCGQLEITDVLQAGLTYLPPPNSSVPSGFTITEAPTGTITITKDDNNLLDGTQYDAVIAVRVNYDLRPLPATINNTVNGRVDPPGPVSWQIATPDSAPPVTIGVANPYWNMTKSLFRPAINPTVNTDVTYQIRLCPGTPPPGEGNVPLQNVTITDTMPVNAVFVSASDAGVFSPPNTVTWPVIAGPINPPNCVTRFVTIRYNSPPFSVGDNVTNTASADAEYIGSSGGVVGPTNVATDPITHPIASTVEVPTYSKNDLGDPVGFSGTGRFVLNLNTNATNYPSNELVLIDNLPPELQVTQVTSGVWSASFNFVRAYVEYSTNNGSSYTAFPGQPISYNTNATYNAPATNITNVRWRFEYDPTPNAVPPFSFTQAGLPYTWAFTTSPQIRITPRAVATTADPPSGTAMPAAVAGTTYNNCLQVNRRNSSGILITDPCDNETMTVQGSLVSLRTFKAETTGTSWDDVGDPLINTFTTDGNLLPGDTLRYTITVQVTERSSAPLIDPTILDTIPADLVFVRNGTARLDGVALATQPTFSQPGANQLQWDFPGLTVNPLVLGSRSLTVEFFARIPPGQTPGARTNNMYVVTDSVDALCEIGTQVNDNDNGDIDGDGDLTDPACQNTDNYTVERSAALRGEKWIRSTEAENNQVVDSTTFLPSGSCPDGGTVGLPTGGSNPFTRYPCISQAFLEGSLSVGQRIPPPLSTTLDDFEYNLRIFNDGNVDMLSYVLYDILPYYGDTGSGGTLSASPRLSEFRPTLRGPVEFISGSGGLSAANFLIEYNNTTNPCRPEVFNQPVGSTVPAGCNNTWTTTWSNSARSFRIRLISPAVIQPTSAAPEVRFGVPMYIPADAPTLGVFDNDDAQSREIAWNSFSHVGSYDRDPGVPVVIQDLLASEPRKVGITIPERMSVGNRVWRDSDNSGRIDAPDDLAPGIAGVTVNLYRDVNNDGNADGGAIATTTTDVGGYYLFSNIPHDLTDINNNRYIIGIPASNFGAGQPLDKLRSSTGVFAVVGDSDDNGIDPVTPGLDVFSASFTLEPTTEPTAEADLSANDLDGPPGRRRGINGERDNNSDLTLDFGFFGGTDVPFSLGNHVWYDDGQTAPGVFNYALSNDGIRQSTEPPVVGVDVRLYRDGDGDGIPEAAEMMHTDITDANGFYLFDNLDPGPYFVEIPASEFGAGQPLAGWNSSQTTGTENTGVPGNTNTPNTDSDDNGIDNSAPGTNGIFSGVIILTRGVNEQTGETHLSNQPDPDSNPATPNLGVNPTEWDGPSSFGRYGETDATSNLTIDFGFFPVYSLGNRVWHDNGAGGGTANDGVRNGTEPSIDGVTVRLYRDSNDDGAPDGVAIATTTTAGGGFYRFDNLMAETYIVEVVTPTGYTSSTVDAGDADTDVDDDDDNGVIVSGSNIRSNPVTLGLGTNEPINENNPVTNPETGEAADDHSNRTVDFGFITAFSLGNRVWDDNGIGGGTANDGIRNGTEPGIDGVTVNLYRDSNDDGTPDGASIATTTTASDGFYRFDNLPADTYIVEVVTPTGYTSSSVDAGDADTDVDDDDDNGVVISGSNIRSDPVTLGPTGNEPTGETNPVTNPETGEAVDNQSNRTVDFGFYFVPYSLGNRVWIDNGAGGGTANDGVRNGAEPGIDGVTVRLYRDSNNDSIPDGASISTTTTAGGGFYRFDYLMADTYIVEVVTPTGYTSSTVDAGDADTDVDDDDDNGVIVSGSNIRSNPVTLGLGTNEPINENNPVTNPETGEAADDHSNRTVDFGFITAFSLGNRVWDDNGIGGGTANDGIRNGTEPGIDGVTVNLYRDSNDDGTPDGASIATTTTASDGFYRFDNLPADTYIVEVVTPTGYTSSSVDAGDADTDVDDDDDNGVVISGSNIRSDPVTLGPTGNEPTGETNPVTNPETGEAVDNQSNRTVDFGFYFVPYSLGNRVWIDNGAGGGTANDGVRNGAEPGIDGVTVRLYRDSNDDGIPDGASISTTTTASGGFYRFDNLAADTYIVEVVTPAGYTSTVDAGDPDTDADDDDDNGVIVSGSNVRSNPVTLGPGASEPTGENNPLTNPETGEAADDHSNRTVDFGFIVNVVSINMEKTITGTSETFTTGNNVAIGEIVTYQVTLNLPIGLALDNVVVTDRMDKGLAFVDCVSVSLDGTNITSTVCPPTVSAITDPFNLPTNPANPGRQVQFNVGNIPATNTGSTLVIRYRAVVLDVIENQETDALNNSVTLTWTGGTLTASAPDVIIVEPDLAIDKSATPTTVTAGESIQFTLTVTHTALSSTDAFDVVVTDILPDGLEYIACTPITYSGLAPTTQPDPCNIPAGDTLTFVWDTFPLNQSATIVFFARFDGTKPTLINLASVSWSSLPTDLGPDGNPIEISIYNDTSTERWYDPDDLIDVYQTIGGVWINPPASEEEEVDLPSGLPATGFAPNVITTLPEQPAEKSYAATDVWLEIPSIGVNIPIVGVPLVEDDWDVSWLWRQAGWLNGTAFPGWQGNSALTGHVTLPNGKSGPFIGLDKLKWGDKILVHAYGTVYTYEVRQNRTVSPNNTYVLKHEDDAWLTLITCKTYIEETNTYARRIVVRAALVSITTEKQTSTSRGGR